MFFKGNMLCENKLKRLMRKMEKGRQPGYRKREQRMKEGQRAHMSTRFLMQRNWMLAWMMCPLFWKTTMNMCKS